MDNLFQTPKLITVVELAAILQLSAGTIKNILSKNPKALPPRRIVCGTRSVRFLLEDVDRWLRGLPVLQGSSVKLDKNNRVVQKLIPVFAPGEAAQKLRGRPTKAMQIARQLEQDCAGRTA